MRGWWLTRERQELMSLDDLYAKLREEGVEDVSQVKAAFMESDGQISVIRVDGSGAEARRSTR